ncbi:MAG: hypothetical protein IJU19_00875 [Bacteroidales bacterium]|nr:hypothetical protein [Bacteroidales bacterium]
MNEEFTPKITKQTVVYNADGAEIARLEGHVVIRPKDYEEQLPVEYHHITTTTEVIAIARIEK